MDRRTLIERRPAGTTTLIDTRHSSMSMMEGARVTQPRHLVWKAADADFRVPDIYEGRSQGFRRFDAVDAEGPSVHMGFGICELDAGGSVDRHLHDFEESFYVLEGEVVCETGEGVFLLREGDHGVFPVAAPHRWHNASDAPARWAEMTAPQDRSGDAPDTFFVPAAGSGHTPEPLDVRDPRTRSFGHIDAGNMDPEQQTQDKLALSASMRTALLVYSGISVKMMVDSDMGAFLSTMFMVQYVPGGFAGAHDHPFEEAYLILEGVTDAVFDGVPYRLEVGDIAFAGVGSTHEFTNPGDGPVRWLETQAPQPPGRHAYRFGRDWDYLQSQLEEDQGEGGQDV
jgi:mannose-6-phosphate isomerase-like protein (cupin superfamily)